MLYRFSHAVAMAAALLAGGLASAQTATTGQTLFDANCKVCHGGTNPAAGTFNVQKATTAVALQAAITTTSPTMKMMANLQGLSPAQVADIATYVAADVSANATGNVANGRVVYTSQCAVCHGAVPAAGMARVELGMSAAVIQHAMQPGLFGDAMNPAATYRVGRPYALRITATPAELNDVAAFIASDVTAKTTTTPTEPGQTIYTAMCSKCHGGQFSKAANAASTMSAIARDKGGMGVLGFVTTEQATGIAVAMGGGGSSGSGGGGCTLGDAHQPLDPLWLLMLTGAIGVLGWRRSVTPIKA